MAQAPGQAPGQQSPDQAGNQAPDTTKQQDPQWLSAIADETQRDVARKEYMFHGDYTQKTQNLAKEKETFETDRKSWEEGKGKVETEATQYRDWYNQHYQPFYQRLTPHWDDINAVLEGQAKVVRNNQVQATAPEGVAPNGQTSIPTNYWDNYDMLSPQEQATKQNQALIQYALTPLVQQGIQTINQYLTQQFTERDKRDNGRWSLLTDGVQKQVKDPNFPFQTYLENMQKIDSGEIPRSDLAYSVTMAESDKKKLEEDAYNRGKADSDQERQNHQQTDGVLGQGTPQVFTKPQPRTKGAIEADIQGVAAKVGIPWLRG